MSEGFGIVVQSRRFLQLITGMILRSEGGRPRGTDHAKWICVDESAAQDARVQVWCTQHPYGHGIELPNALTPRRNSRMCSVVRQKHARGTCSHYIRLPHSLQEARYMQINPQLWFKPALTAQGLCTHSTAHMSA